MKPSFFIRLGAHWHKLRGLSWPQRWLFVQALVLLPCAALTLRRLKYQWRLLAVPKNEEPPLADNPSHDDDERVHTLARLVRAAADHGPYRAGCLPRSLVLWRLLRRHGFKANLRIGARKQAGRFTAHAWVEYRGRALNDADDVARRFPPFAGALEPIGSA